METLPKDILVKLINIINTDIIKEYKCDLWEIEPLRINKEYREFFHGFILKQWKDGQIILTGVEKNGCRRNPTYKEKLLAWKMGISITFKKIDYYKFNKSQLLYIIANSYKYLTSNQ